MKTLKFSILLTLLVSLFVACENQPKDQFTLEIDLTGTDDIPLYLKQYDGGWVTLDTAMTVNGKATFTGIVDLPEMYFIGFADSRTFVQLFIEASNMTAKIDFANPDEMVVTGSESQKVFEDYKASLAEIDALFEEVNRQYQMASKEKNQELMDQFNAEFEELNDMKSGYIKNFCLKNTSSTVSPYIMMRNSYYYDYEDFDELLAALTPAVQTSVYAKSLQERADVLRKVAVGQPFLDFILEDPEGNPVALSSVIGENYVLIDFWASWCMPCRAENPNIVLAYQTYHEKGFDVFGVSLDRDHDKWIAAIEKDELTWNHVSDLKFWNSEAGQLYGVNSIPHSVLVDPNGIIIAKNLREEALQTKLAELLN